MFPNPSLVTKVISWVVIFGLFGAILYISIVNGMALNYRPERIIDRFVSLIENPTQTITDEEKRELQDIMQSGFFRDWNNEQNIKFLRRMAQGNQITYENIIYTGQSRRVASAQLNFENSYKNPESKKAIIYMERYGTILTGIKWRIFQIDMPKSDSIFDDPAQATQKVLDQARDGASDVWDRIRNWFR